MKGLQGAKTGPTNAGKDGSRLSGGSHGGGSKGYTAKVGRSESAGSSKTKKTGETTSRRSSGY